MSQKLCYLSLLLLSLTALPINGQLAETSIDFEGVDPVSETAISDLGYSVFASVFDLDGNFLGGGGGPAPNSAAPMGGNGFCGIIPDIGAGDFSINVFSDYDSAIHNNPNEILESNVFLEQIPDASNVGETWTYSFIYRRAGDDMGMDIGPSDGATANAYIRVIDSGNFNLIDEFTLDTGTKGTLEFQPGSISVEILADYAGNFFQFGFNNRAIMFENTGMYYDNIEFAEAADCLPGDVDMNGEVNLLDVQPFIDEVLSGTSTLCEADVDQNGSVNLLDVQPFIDLVLP